jgi:hypothetical protein
MYIYTIFLHGKWIWFLYYFYGFKLKKNDSEISRDMDN